MPCRIGPVTFPRTGRRRLGSGCMATGILSAVGAVTTTALTVTRACGLFPPCTDPSCRELMIR
ncbi:hypothetical protein CGRA01v4_03906 [Colletotrichum graminicola]|nr:hypothetical protein CGRA01v4_03906 [Colletotrichum graminicola]